MPGRAKHRRGLAAVAAVALALTGCAAADAADGLPPGVAVELTQLRSDVAERRMQVRVQNDTDAVIEVEGVTVADRRFAEPAHRVNDRPTSIAPGRTVALPVQLAPAACAAPAAVDVTVTLTYRLDDALRTTTVAAREDFPFLADLHARECLAASVAASAALSLGPFAPSPPGEPAVLPLEVAPHTGGAAVRLVAIRETNLLSYRQRDAAATAYPLDRRVGATAESIALPIVPARCDPHAVQEDKRGTVFTLDVEVDGHAGTIQLAASPELRADILTWVTAWCRG